MVEKVKVTKAVEEVLNKNPSWMPALANTLTSPSKVARQVHAEVARIIGVPAKNIRLDTIVKAVKIYMAGKGKVSDLEKIQGIIAESKLTLYSDLAVLTVKTGMDIGKKISEVIDVVYKGDQTLYIGQGKLQTSLVFSSENLEKIKKIFKTEEILDTTTKCTGILIEAQGLADYEPIEYDSYILALLASHGIPLPGYMSLYTNTLILIQDKDSFEAFKILKTEVERLRKEMGLK